MKLEDALAKTSADLASSANMHARDMRAANDSIASAQEQVARLQEQLDASTARVESLGGELATVSEEQQLSTTQVSDVADAPVGARV
jgi:hypothetical protein